MKKILKHGKENILNSFTVIFDNLKKENIKRNFIESIDVSIILDIDIKDANQYIIGSVKLPYFNGKKYKIFILDDNLNKDLVLSWGADLININDLINKKINYNFNLVITTPNYFNKYSDKISNLLASKNIIPNIKLGTITNDIKSSVYDFLNGKIIYRNDKFGIINLCIGKINFDSYKLSNNLLTLLNSIKLNKSKFIKTFMFIKKIFVSSTMGKSYIIKM